MSLAFLLVSLGAMAILRSGKGYMRMKVLVGIIIFTFIALWFMLEANALVFQERYPTFTGTVVATHGGLKRWLDVKSNNDELIVIFRIGRDTVYPP
jgi:hypothetical protein